jgi:vancomycin resistance protein YoaR
MKKKILQVAGVSATGIIMVIIAAGIIFEARFWEKAYPGVVVAGVRAEGMTASEAENKIAEKLKRRGEISLVLENNKWTIAADKIGWKYDFGQSARQAVEAGRGGNLIEDSKMKFLGWKTGWKVDPVFTLDENKLNAELAAVATQIDIPAKEPEIILDKGNQKIVVSAGENGQEVDDRLLKQKIKLAIKNGSDDPIEVPLTQLKPKLSDEQLEMAKTRAQELVGKTLTINFAEENQKWTINDEQMFTWMNPQTNGWNRQEMENWVAELAAGIDRPAQNANFRFISEGRVEEFKPGKEGYQTDQSVTIDNIVGGLNSIAAGKQEVTVNLIVRKTEPEVGTAQVNNLGIKELLGRGESWFSGSIDNRIFNIHKATDALNGILVAPGETFSFNKVIGEVSVNTGYKQAYIIKDGKTILGDGGGVCQVSSTMFRAILHAGLPIMERVAHAYRVSYYEEKSEPGFDATIFQPSPDLKFKNDTPAYVLIQTTFDEKNKHVFFDIYGTSDGRKVEISKARIWEVTPPPPALYQDDPTLPVGTIKQTEHAAWGAKVAFDWKVTRSEEILQQRTFYSNYVPWQAVYLKGTKI